MAEIAPIRGLLYDPSRVEVSKVIAPPYDVISPDERRGLEQQDPHNCVRLILPAGDGDAKYSAAAQLLAEWQAAGVLRRDARPAIYRYHQVFAHAELGGRRVTRQGLIAAVRLHGYDERIIRPHERTLRGPKEDRLKLMRACRAHFSQIFGLYRDPALAVDQLLRRYDAVKPDLEGTTADGTVHRLWRVADREAIAGIARIMAPLPIYIADGHHRYETMLALRDELRAAAGGALPPHATPEFATFFLCNMQDPGLVVLPTHRLIHSVPELGRESLLEKAGQYFAVMPIERGARDAAVLRAAITEEARKRPTFAAVFPEDERAWLFGLRDAAQVLQDTPRASRVARAVRLLDVALLHELVLEKVLGIDRQAQEAQKNIVYVKDTRDALERVARGEAQVGFIVHPTRVEQVKAVADAGESMPQKSTFFFPKIASGLVVNPIDPAEDVDRAI